MKRSATWPRRVAWLALRRGLFLLVQAVPERDNASSDASRKYVQGRYAAIVRLQRDEKLWQVTWP